jgi:hypothetical protein
VALQERLVRDGYRDGGALYCRIRSRLFCTFATLGDHSDRRADGLAKWILCSARAAAMKRYEQSWNVL